MPLTREDYERISNLSAETRVLTRSLQSSRNDLRGFTHTLEKQADGSCQFLTPEKRCKLHLEFGAESKPSMCCLFPYSFTVTPDAVFASVSFASSAVLLNTGRLLSDQQEALLEQFQVFQRLFEVNSQAWRKIQLIDGRESSWERFCEIDQELAAICKPEESHLDNRYLFSADFRSKLQDCASLILKRLPDPSAAEREPRMESRPKIIDQVLLKHLEQLYFPAQVFAEDKYDIDAKGMMHELISAPQVVSFGQTGQSCRFGELIKIRLGKLSPEIEDLIGRFFYTRFFSKLYFGPGFHHFSLLAGINHLRTLNILLRLKIKQARCLRPDEPVSFELACELVRTLERRLTQLDFSGQSLAMLEVLLASPARQDRLTFLSE